MRHGDLQLPINLTNLNESRRGFKNRLFPIKDAVHPRTSCHQMLWALKDEVPAQVRKNGKIHAFKMPNHPGSVVAETAICNVNVTTITLIVSQITMRCCSPPRYLGPLLQDGFCFRMRRTSLQDVFS